MSEADYKEYAAITREQNACHKWKEHRSKRLTASFFWNCLQNEGEQKCLMGLRKRSCAFPVCHWKQYFHLPVWTDGLIGGKDVIEVKCPTTAKLFTPPAAVVQGILHVSKRKFCHFVVWLPKSIICDIVERNDNFWREKIISKHSTFDFNCLLREIIYSRYARQLAIRNTDYIIIAQTMLALK
ncbi:hypothetical protein PR048_004420, partial [Dryococelus australis]